MEILCGATVTFSSSNIFLESCRFRYISKLRYIGLEEFYGFAAFLFPAVLFFANYNHPQHLDNWFWLGLIHILFPTANLRLTSCCWAWIQLLALSAVGEVLLPSPLWLLVSSSLRRPSTKIHEFAAFQTWFHGSFSAASSQRSHRVTADSKPMGYLNSWHITKGWLKPRRSFRTSTWLIIFLNKTLFLLFAKCSANTSVSLANCSIKNWTDLQQMQDKTA